jgi:hypothetical protein
MMVDDFVFQLGRGWFDLGVVTASRLAEIRAEWARGEDRSPEHYRWRAFTAFLEERRPLGPQLAAALYELGATDPGRAMGESMMHRIIALPECPRSVIDVAATSGHRHLLKVLERRSSGSRSTGSHLDSAV